MRGKGGDGDGGKVSRGAAHSESAVTAEPDIGTACFSCCSVVSVQKCWRFRFNLQPVRMGGGGSGNTAERFKM